MWDGRLTADPPHLRPPTPEEAAPPPEVAAADPAPPPPAEVAEPPADDSIFSGLPDEARAVAENAARVIHAASGRASEALECSAQVAQAFSPEVSSLLATTAALARRVGW